MNIEKLNKYQGVVDLHTHTVASSHAYSTIYEYINMAADKGVKLIGCSDHGTELSDGAFHKWHFLNLKCVPSYCEGVIILKGIEANIREDGSTNCNDSFLDVLDYVMAGFHAPVCCGNNDVQRNTKLLKKVICSGTVDIISHPANCRYPIDIEEIVKDSLKHNVALEINSSAYSRTGENNENMTVDLIRCAKSYNAPLIIGSDAHICYGLAEFELACRLFEKAECPLSYALNDSPKKLLEFLISRNHSKLDDLLQYCG